MSIVTILIAFFVPVSVMIGLYVRVWWETVKRQKELHTLQGGGRSNGEKGRNGGRSGAIPKNGSKRSDSRYSHSPCLPPSLYLSMPNFMGHLRRLLSIRASSYPDTI